MSSHIARIGFWIHDMYNMYNGLWYHSMVQSLKLHAKSMQNVTTCPINLHRNIKMLLL